MIISASRCMSVFTTLFLCGITFLAAQQTNVATGTPAFGSFAGGPDIIDLGNLNIHMAFPIARKPGRGLDFDFTDNLESTYWTITTSGTTKTWTAAAADPAFTGGYSANGGASAGILTYLTEQNTTIPCPGTQVYSLEYYSFTYQDADGVVHPFGSSTYTLPNCPSGPVNNGFPSTSSDGSGITLSIGPNNSYTATFPSGGSFNLTAGGSISGGNGAVMASTTSYGPCGGTRNGTLLSGLIWYEGNGSTVSFTPGGGEDGATIAYGANCPNGIVTTYLPFTTSSGYTLNCECAGLPSIPPYFVITLPTGVSIDVPWDDVGDDFSDRNGNYVTLYASTLGAVDTLGTDVASNSGYPQPTANEALYLVKTAFGCSGINETTASNYLVNNIELTDGRQYLFGYEATPGYPADITGRLTSITLPAGGTITYVYSGINCNDGTPMNLTRTVNDGEGNTYKWTYSRAQNGTGWTTTVTDPNLNQTVYSFITGTPAAPIGATPIQYFYETQRQVYSGSASGGTLLETVQSCFNSVCGGTAPLTYPITTYQVNTSFPSSTAGRTASTITDLSSLGLVTETQTYDYGAVGAGPGVLINSAITHYATLGQVYDRPSSVTRYDGVGNIVSETAYTYDESEYVTTSPPTPQHITGVSVGNATTTKSYVSSSAYLTAHTYYQDTGVVTETLSSAGVVTNYVGLACGNSFPSDKILNIGQPYQLIWETQFDCFRGVATDSFDQNFNENVFGYDSSLRLNSSTDPLGNVTSYTYPTMSSNTSSKSLTFNGGSSISKNVTSYDGLGRPILSQTLQAPGSSTYDTVATNLDQYGRTTWKSLPAAEPLGTAPPKASSPGTTTAYDVLGRVTSTSDSGGGTVTYTYTGNDVLIVQGPAPTTPTGQHTKQRQLEYNGAGELTSVCEITTMSGSGACGQFVAQTGFLTKYTYDGAGRLTGVSQNAQAGSTSIQTRTMHYDWLGRETSETMPESGNSSFTYDSVSSTACTESSPGALVESTDNDGNVTCFAYDDLQRLTSTTVVAGSYMSATPQICNIYDVATLPLASPNNVAMQNVKGSLAETFTPTVPGTCQLTTPKLTDQFFSSTPEVSGGSNTGRLINQMWEATPHSSGYFMTQTTTFPNGATGAISASLLVGATSTSFGIPNMTYSVDGEGRGYSATDSTHSINLVSTTTYNPSGSPVSIGYGQSDVDSYHYDPNTNRPTSFTFTVNASPLYTFSGTMTWNSDASLQTYARTDTNDPTKNQSCTYAMDDLDRIASVNCGAPWSQNFTYHDPFGNMTKTGTQSYMASYNYATNQVSMGTPAIYDANGNQLMNANYPYSWNAAGQAVKVNNVGASYDALGRMVETASGSVYTQYLYTPNGSRLAVYQGTSLLKGFIPLPGNATAVYNASGLSFLRHKDWLGSSLLGTTWSHAVYSKEAYAPFGETYLTAGTSDASFTGKDPEIAAGIYDFLFRKYDSLAGRWLSPDPSGWSAVNTAYPQSLDRYVYVSNNPMTMTDALGLDEGDPDDGCAANSGEMCNPDYNGPAPSPNPLYQAQPCANYSAACGTPPNPALFWQDAMAFLCNDGLGDGTGCSGPSSAPGSNSPMGDMAGFLPLDFAANIVPHCQVVSVDIDLFQKPIQVPLPSGRVVVGAIPEALGGPVSFGWNFLGGISPHVVRNIQFCPGT